MSADHKEEAQKISALMLRQRIDHIRETDTQEVDGTWHTIEYCSVCSDSIDIPDWPCPTILMLDNYEELIKLVAYLRPEVLEFSREMEKKLRKHDGDRDGWVIETGESLYPLYRSLMNHTKKLLKPTLTIDTPDSLDAIISSAADVANFAMMIANNARRWKELLKEGEEK